MYRGVVGWDDENHHPPNWAAWLPACSEGTEMGSASGMQPAIANRLPLLPTPGTCDRRTAAGLRQLLAEMNRAPALGRRSPTPRPGCPPGPAPPAPQISAFLRPGSSPTVSRHYGTVALP